MIKKAIKWIFFNIYLNLICKNISFLKPIYETYGTGSMITAHKWFMQRVLGYNRFVPWPVDFRSIVSGHTFIKIGIGTAPGFSHGCYVTANEENPIEVGDYTLFAPNTMILGINHDVYDLRIPTGKGGIRIGKYCWIGGNSVILSGVELGDHTIVAAGSIVTKSFPEGNCIIGGNPARKIKELDREKFIEYSNKFPYIGYKKSH